MRSGTLLPAAALTLGALVAPTLARAQVSAAPGPMLNAFRQGGDLPGSRLMTPGGGTGASPTAEYALLGRGNEATVEVTTTPVKAEKDAKARARRRPGPGGPKLPL